MWGSCYGTRFLNKHLEFLIIFSAVHLEVGIKNIYGVYAFRRADLNLCRPTALFPTLRPTIQVKCSPVLYKLEEGANFLGYS